MEKETIKEIRFLCVAVAGICLFEAVGVILLRPAISPVAALAVLRAAELGFLSVLAALFPTASAGLRIRLKNAAAGARAGLAWSAAFACVAAVSGLVLYAAGFHPLEMIRIPKFPDQLFLFFITGGLIAPAAEELFFRGILYSFLRRLGIFPAVVLSTALFTLFHMSGSGFPLIQMIGGVVFAVSFEHAKSLITPFIIHSSGNLAIFLISLV